MTASTEGLRAALFDCYVLLPPERLDLLRDETKQTIDAAAALRDTGPRPDSDAVLLANAILGGSSYLPHREAAERILARDTGPRPDSDRPTWPSMTRTQRNEYADPARDTGPRPDSGIERPAMTDHTHGPWVGTDTPGVLACASCGHEEDCRPDRASAEGLRERIEALDEAMKETGFWGRVSFYLGPNARTAVDDRPYKRVKSAYDALLAALRDTGPRPDSEGPWRDDQGYWLGGMGTPDTGPRPDSGIDDHEHDHDCQSGNGKTHRHEYRHTHPVEHLHRHEHPTDEQVARRIALSTPRTETPDHD